MNKDHIEEKLATLCKALNEEDPTPAWKTDILSRAMKDSHLAETKRRMLPPRWLMASWGSAWAAAFVLNLMVPEAAMLPPSTQPVTAFASSELHETLFAYQCQLTLNLDSLE